MISRHDLGKYNLDHVAQEKFWARVEKKKDDCWLWTGSTNSEHRSGGGYGKFRVKGKFLRSHVYAWAIFHGIPPEGMVVAHKCDNRRCVNPAHLQLKTQKENVADMYARHRNHKMVLLSDRQCEMLATRLGITITELDDAIDWVKGQPKIKQMILGANRIAR